jgi:hypothetical protein
MQKLLPALAAAMTVTAIILSSGAAYAQLAHQMRAQQNESAEVLKVHATTQISMQATLDQPSVPAFYLEPPLSRR